MFVASETEKNVAGEAKAKDSPLTSTDDLVFTLSAWRRERLNAGILTEETWSECVLRAKKELLGKQGEADQNTWRGKRALVRCWKLQCMFFRHICRLMWLGFLSLVMLGVFLLLCKPASFYLHRKLHTR